MKISDAVSAEIMRLCSILGITEDALLRKLLKMDDSSQPTVASFGLIKREKETADYFHTGEGALPLGLRLKKVTREGQVYEAVVTKSGIEVAGKGTFPSVSKAAGKLMGHNENGWKFWKYHDTDSDKWLPLVRLKD